MINEQTRDKIDRTRSYLLSSALPEDTKDGLQSLLDAAGAAANGAQDKLASLTDAFLLLIIHEVRQSIRNPIAFEAMVKRHETQCRMTMPAGKVGIFLQCIKSWPLGLAVCALAFSPHLPAIIDAVKNQFSK